MTNQVINPVQFFPDLEGRPLDGGRVYIGQPNVNPVTNPIAVYQDQALSIPFQQPLRTEGGMITLNGSARVAYIGSVPYSLLVTDRRGRMILSLPSVQEFFDVAPLSVLMYGADPTGIADSTTAIQEAITLAKTTGQPVYIPAGTYLTTKSLNGTFAAQSSQPLRIFGDGLNNTTISGVLTEAFPILDYTNNKRGSLKRLTIQSTNASLDTGALLLAESGATLGSLITLSDCGLSTSSPSAQASVVNFCADQMNMVRCNVGASTKYGMLWGHQNLAGVSSKFESVAAEGGDVTYGSFIGSQFLGAANAAFSFTGGDECSFTDCYFGLTGTGGPSIFDFDNGGYTGALSMRGCRTENQSSYSGALIFNIKTQLSTAMLEGNFTSDSSGAVFGGAGAISDVELHSVIGSCPLFNNTGVISNSTFEYQGGLSTPIGTVGAAASCYNLTFKGRASLAAVQSVFGSIPGLKVYAGDQYYESNAAASLFPNSGAPVNYRPLAAGDCELMTTTSYTGGSGLQTVASYTWNPLVLESASLLGTSLANRFAEIDIYGDVQPGVASPVVAVQIVQGSDTMTLLSATLVAGSAGLHIKLRFMITSGLTMVCYAEAESNSTTTGSGFGTPSGGAQFNSASSFTTAGITVGGGTIAINVQVASASNNPLANMIITNKA
jgi:hypothetical protein